MHLIHSLSGTPIGRALAAYFFGLPRWTLANIVFAASLLPALLALLDGAFEMIVPSSFPGAVAGAAIINMAAREAHSKAARWRDAFAHPATFIAAVLFWLVLVLVSSMLFVELPLIAICGICIGALMLLMISVFALCVPALLDLDGLLVWRNALVLAVHHPIVAMGLVALIAISIWLVWLTRGALLLVVPSLWALVASFTTQDRINAIRESTQTN
jgi:hypothetical protein